MSQLDSFLEPDGAASRVIDGFQPRAAQASMASAVSEAIHHRENLLVEAGTGTGKTFAYLLPLMLSGKKCIISTGTKTLQDQLWRSDLPRVREMTGMSRRLALLKGRSNYLCPARLDRHIRQLASNRRPELQARLIEISRWSRATRSGDLDEIIDPETELELVSLITSTADNCLGKECGWLSECPLYRARERAAEADVIVVNHHLLFSDMALGDDVSTPLLPKADVVLVDEAHRTASVARQFFGHRLSSRQLLDLTTEVMAEYQAFGREDISVREAVRHFEMCLARLSNAWREDGARDESVMAEAIEDMDLGFAALVSALDTVRSRSRVYELCYQRTLRYLDLFALLTDSASDDSEGHARWIERRASGFALHLAPVSIADDFGARVREGAQTWILTSATLSVGGTFDHVIRDLGLDGIATASFDSPFDFHHQVGAWVPPINAAPGSTGHTAELIDRCLPLLQACTGRTFLLFTSHRALQEAALILSRIGSINCLVQGTASRSALLEQFRHAERAVLLATQSFWEGVDVRGANLKLLIIDKLPFPSPAEPLINARMKAIEAAGQDSFFELMLPEAITGLRQGFGRLIREEGDRGVFVLGDPRVRTRSYGSMVLGSLPAVDWLSDEAALMARLSESPA